MSSGVESGLGMRLPEVLLCPSCAQPALNSDLRCTACGKAVSHVGRVPMLVSAPERWLDQFRGELLATRRGAATTVAALEREARKPGLLATTRRRLAAQCEITTALIDDVERVLLPALGEPRGDELPRVDFHPLSGLHFLHRDWGGGGEEEVERTLDLVQQVLAPRALGRALVLGTGGSRLAHELHLLRGATLTLALDVDPFVLLVAESVTSGNTVTLTEARSNATDLEQLSKRRELRLRGPRPENFHLALADGLAAPLREGVFDTIVTPWFIDLVPDDMRTFLGTLSRLLAPGGQWVNVGPLLYPEERGLALRYSEQELFELVEMAGFSLGGRAHDVVPFSYSPLAQRGKLEGVVAFRADWGAYGDRAGGVPAAHELTLSGGTLPAWLVLPHLLVPRLCDGPAPEQGRVGLRILALADGTRSIGDIARALSVHSEADARVLTDVVRHCLVEVLRFRSDVS